MFRTEVTIDGNKIELVLPVDNGNESSPILFVGDPMLEWRVNSYLETAFGAFGHRISPSSVNAIDLHAALNQSPFTVTILEGEELVKTYDPEIPEGAMT